MSHADFHAWLFKAATGWLGWTPAVALATPIPQIAAAHDGRIDMLAALFGGRKEAAPQTPLTAAAFDAMFTAKG